MNDDDGKPPVDLNRLMAELEETTERCLGQPLTTRRQQIDYLRACGVFPYFTRTYFALSKIFTGKNPLQRSRTKALEYLPDCYDRDGFRLTSWEQYEELTSDGSKRCVGENVMLDPECRPCLVRTMFLVSDERRPWDSKPILYETTVTYPTEDGPCLVGRYSTEAEAKAGHRAWVDRAGAGWRPA